MSGTTAREVDFALAILPYIGAAILIICAALVLAYIALAAADFIRDCRKYTAWRSEDAYTVRRIGGGRRRRK